MLVVVAYDVNTETSAGRRRLRRIALACRDFGQRVQKSVFECKVDDAGWVVLKHRLLKEMKEEEDSLRFYFLDDDNHAKTEHHGQGRPIDLEGPLII